MALIRWLFMSLLILECFGSRTKIAQHVDDGFPPCIESLSSNNSSACPSIETMKAAFKEVLTMPIAAKSTDIHEHLQILRSYASKASSITELGVRHGVASWALALGAHDRISKGESFEFYTAADITRQPRIDCLERVLKHCPVLNFKYTECDDLVVKPWGSDLTFIDTWHTNAQLTAELKVWAPLTKKYLIFHDTTSFAHRDETIAGHGGKPINPELYKRSDKRQVGLRPAISAFLAANNNDWVLTLDRPRNNGLMILTRAPTNNTRCLGNVLHYILILVSNLGFRFEGPEKVDRVSRSIPVILRLSTIAPFEPTVLLE
jgi:hypothetical protein